VGKNGRQIKDCSNCTYPHDPENYAAVVEFLKKKYE
jgi:Zn-finger protein